MKVELNFEIGTTTNDNKIHTDKNTWHKVYKCICNVFVRILY